MAYKLKTSLPGDEKKVKLTKDKSGKFTYKYVNAPGDTISASSIDMATARRKMSSKLNSKGVRVKF